MIFKKKSIFLCFCGYGLHVMYMNIKNFTNKLAISLNINL